jgi:hypothetical protein
MSASTNLAGEELVAGDGGVIAVAAADDRLAGVIAVSALERYGVGLRVDIFKPTPGIVVVAGELSMPCSAGPDPNASSGVFPRLGVIEFT